MAETSLEQQQQQQQQQTGKKTTKKEKTEEDKEREARYKARKREKKSHEDPFDVDLWYDRLKDFTFRTEFADMTLKEAKALRDDYRERFFERTKTTDEQKRVLAEVERKLDGLIQQVLDRSKAGVGGGGVFVRLSTRSPKDSSLIGEDSTIESIAAALESHAREKHQQRTQLQDGGEIKQFEYYAPDMLTTNDKVVCLMEGFGKDLKVNSASAALGLLKSSERVYVDILDAITAYKSACQTEGKDKAVFRMKYIVREWVDIPVGMEFRGFVNKVTLNALNVRVPLLSILRTVAILGRTDGIVSIRPHCLLRGACQAQVRDRVSHQVVLFNHTISVSGTSLR